MLNAKAKVIEVVAGKVKVEVDGCSGCRACQRILTLPNDNQNNIGDIIEFNCDEKKVLKLAFRFYGLPIITGILSIFILKYALNFEDIYIAASSFFVILFTMFVARYK